MSYSRSSVVVDNLDIDRAGGGPPKADPILIVDADRVLARTVAPEPFEAIRWWGAEVRELLRLVQLIELSFRDGPQAAGTSSACRLRVPAVEDVLGRAIPEALNHSIV